jgi:hypothetical protein
MLQIVQKTVSRRLAEAGERSRLLPFPPPQASGNICLQQDFSLQEDWMQQELVMRSDRVDAKPGRNRARFQFRAGRVEVSAEVDITSTGLVAVGALVSMILLSVPPIIRAAKGR